MRKYWLDNIRWGTVFLVVIYHVFYIFNASNVFGSIGKFERVQYQDSILYFVYPWFMVLLYLVSGISTKYALKKYSNKEFVKARTVKLLVPSTLGVLVFQWMGGWFNVAAAEGFDSIPNDIPVAAKAVIQYILSVIFGIGPLWFIQLLWLFSLIIILLRKVDKSEKFYSLCGKVNFPVMILFALLIWGSSFVLNAPIVTVYRVGIYLTAFLLGYFVFSHEQVQERIQKFAIPLAVVAACMGIGFTILYFGKNYADNSVLTSPVTNIYLWTAVLAVLACGRKFLDKTNKFAEYLSKCSWGIYIIHYLPLIASAYFLYNNTELPGIVIYAAVLAFTIIISLLLYELIRRIPGLRYVILGIRNDKEKTKTIIKNEEKI